MGMIKSLFLIFEPVAAWTRIAQARRKIPSVIAFYLLPMMLIVAVVEGYGLVEWGRARGLFGEIHRFTVREAFELEVSQMALMAVVILFAAYLIKAFGDTFRVRNTYTQTFALVSYGLSPLFLLRLLDVIPTISLWVFWGVGILFTVKVIYIGVPCMMEPDPPHALGLFLMSALILILFTAAERFVSIGYLTGKYQPISEVLLHILARLHPVK